MVILVWLVICLLWVILCSLATFRISEMLYLDDGPFEIFDDLRGYFNPAICEDRTLRKTIADLLECPHCIGVWVSIPMALVFSVCSAIGFVAGFFFTCNPALIFEAVISVLVFPVVWFAIAGIQSILSGNLGRSK